MLSTLPSLPAVSTTPATPPQAGPAAPEHNEQSRAFARQLQEAQSQDHRNSSGQKAATPQPSTQHTSPVAGGKARAEASEDRDTAAPAAHTKAPVDAAPTGTTDTTDTTAQADGDSLTDTATGEAGPQDLSALLAHLRGHSAAALEATARRGAAGADADGGAAAKAGKSSLLGKNGPAADALAGPDAAASRPDALVADQATGRAQAREAVSQASSASFKERLATAQMQVQEQPAPPAEPHPLPDASTFSTALAAAAGPAAQATAGNSAATPAQAPVPAALGSPDFAPQVGAQISTFVRDGVQHAQLHLNPAEMGPVTVQIQLEGLTAQVHLMAEHAPTRQALEQAMPQLAGSLREAGLTLTGGGVFQQPRQTGGEAGSQDGPASRSRGGVTAVGGRGQGTGSGPDRGDASTRSVAAPRRRGVVDLVA
jgi:flagellar hook-length control protein FliK